MFENFKENILEYVDAHWLESLFKELTISKDFEFVFFLLVDLVAITLLSVLVGFVVKKIFNGVLNTLIKKSKTNIDDVLEEKGVFKALANLAPLLVLMVLFPILFEPFTEILKLTSAIFKILLIVAFIRVLNKTINGITYAFATSSNFKEKAFDSYGQVVKILVYIGGALAIASIVLGDDIGKLFAGLGAMAAVILLIFKDSILGLVASIQMAANQVVQVGDWVSLPKHGADGNVEKITLATVRIQNFDNTVSTVPSYAFINEGVKNWRGMEKSGVRRIKRSLHIKATSVTFLEKNEVEELKSILLIKEYLEKKENEIALHNQEKQIEKINRVNGRNLTNLGVFRQYATEYLKQNDLISKGATLMVRQLELKEKGIPLELYCFANTTAWIEYEAIQSDIFDHLIAAAPYFGLELFQNPTGVDFSKMS